MPESGIQREIKPVDEASDTVQKNIGYIADIPPQKQLRREIITFVWPCVAELFLVSLISTISMMMVGRLGPYAISAVGITLQPLYVSSSVFQAFNIGATALVSRFIGARKYGSAKAVVAQSMAIAVVSGILLGVLGFFTSRWIVVVMGAQEDTVDYAELYMKYMCIGVIFQAVPFSVSSLLRGAGDTKSPMIYNMTSNIINVILGYMLIYGFYGISGLGVEGAAIAALAANIIACIMSVYMICTTKLPIAFSFRDKFRLDFKLLKRIMNIGYAAAGEQFVLRAGVLIFTKMVIDLGTVAFAAHQIGISVISLSFNVGQALGMAATSFMGRSLGAKAPSLAEAYCRETRRIGLFTSVIMAACFFFLGKWIAVLYTSDLNVIAYVALILKIYAFNMPAQNSQLIISGGLRGAGDTRWPLISAMAGVILFRLIFGYLFINILQWGIIGAWLSMMIDQFVRSAVIFFRFRTGKWKNIKV